jgi:hypothetical protein
VNPSDLDLSVVVPITGPPIRIHNLLTWLPQFAQFNGEVILVHDINDLETSRLLKQTVRDLEGIFILKLVEGKFGSPGAARNVGKEIAAARWITFWDCDDLPDLSNVKSVMAESSSEEIDFICGSFEVVDAKQQFAKTDHINSGDVKFDLKKLSLNPGLWRFLFKTNSIREQKFLSISMAEDQSFLLDYNLAVRRGTFSPTVTYSYYTGLNGQLTRTKSAFYDLKTSIKHIDSCRAIRGRDIYLETIYLRQLITGIKRGSFGIKVFCFFKLLLKIFDLANLTSLEALSEVLSPSKRKLTFNG